MEQDIIQLAGCIITDDYGRLLLLHRYTGDGQWELPGGKVEEEETPEATAVRKIREELDVAVALTATLGKAQFEQSDIIYEYHWFQAVIIGGQAQAIETEIFDDLDYFELEDLPSLALSANMLLLQDKLFSGEITLQQ